METDGLQSNWGYGSGQKKECVDIKTIKITTGPYVTHKTGNGMHIGHLCFNSIRSVSIRLLLNAYD